MFFCLFFNLIASCWLSRLILLRRTLGKSLNDRPISNKQSSFHRREKKANCERQLKLKRRQLSVQILYRPYLRTRNRNIEGVTGKRGCTHRDFRRVEIYVVNSATGKVSPAWGQPLFDGLERYIEVDDCVHTVGFIQSVRLGYSTRKAWKRDRWTEGSEGQSTEEEGGVG